jgi:DNA-binding beta-propeller fold protein YncE
VWAGSLGADHQGNVYFSGDTARVWKIVSDGMLTLFAGSGMTAVPAPAPGPIPALEYGMIYPGRIDNADSSGQTARVAPDGSLTVIAGTGAPGMTDGCTPDRAGVPQAIHATLNWPADLGIDAAGNLYVSSAGRVRMITRDGLIRTVAGGPGGAFGGDAGVAAEALLAGPAALAFDSRGNLYIADRNNNRVRRIDKSGIMQTVAGSGAAAGQDPACFARDPAVLSQPSGVAVDPDDNVYISDTGNHQILKLTPGGSIAQIAGTGEAGSKGDAGPAAAAQLSSPTALAFAFGNLYIAEAERIRYITADGTINTFHAPDYGVTGLA